MTQGAIAAVLSRLVPHDALAARTGEAGLAFVQKHADAGMVFVAEPLPGMGAPDFIRRVRERQIPLPVIVTVYPEAVDSIEGLRQAGAIHCLVHPFSEPELRNLLGPLVRQGERP